MNDVLRTIYARRSIRAFKNEQIKREDLDAIIEAGLCAPSANNSQNRHFTVIQNIEVILKVNNWVLDEIEQSGNARLHQIAGERRIGNVFGDAPTMIIISVQQNDRFGAINAAAATQNILLAAESLGIASCWVGMVSILAISSNILSYMRELKIPEGYLPQNGISLGYRASESPPAPERKENLVSYIV